MDDLRTFSLKHKQKEDIISYILSDLNKRQEVIFSYIYGSFVDPEMPFFRDIDISVYVNNNIISPNQYLDYGLNISLEIESTLQKYPVNVVVMNDLPLTLSFKITEGTLLFTKDEGLWTEFVTSTWGLYHDHAITSRGLLEQMINI